VITVIIATINEVTWLWLSYCDIWSSGAAAALLGPGLR